MIEELREDIICDRDGNAYARRAPSNFELMEKINELIEVINKLQSEKEESNEEN